MNIIGAGNLGKTLGYLLLKQGVVKIGGICNRSLESSASAIQFIGGGNPFNSIAELPPSDITLIATPDEIIQSSCVQLSKNSLLEEGSLVFHCSGSLTSDVLESVKKKECRIMSIHPMRSFAKPELSISEYRGTYCAMEGDDDAINIVKELFEAIGSNTYKINKSNKSIYHAAGVFASNYLITISQQALVCMEEAGVPDDIAIDVITNLMKGSLANLEKTKSPVKSLTGPIKRGDVETVKKHIDSLSDDKRDLYAALGKATLPLSGHDAIKKKELYNTLDIGDSMKSSNKIANPMFF